MMSSSGMNRFPFTASQYQELEHQALIFKYIISGMQIPPELLFSMKRSSSLDSPFSSSSSKFLSHQPQHVGWNCFQMGLGKKIDLEPGRCRRTDGKKWRCSKEAYPDSKYCERHMHRGKNRSRKPVETTTPPPPPPPTSSSSSSSSNTTTTAISSSETSNASLSISSMNKNLYSLNQSPAPSLYFASDTHHHSNAYSSAYLHHHGHHPSSYSSSRSPGIGLSSPQDNSTNFLMDTGSYSQDCRRNRYLYGIKENVDEHAFFAEPSGTMKSMDDSWQLTPLTISSSSSSSKQSSDYSSYLQLQSQGKPEEMKCEDSNGGEHEPQRQKTIHRFFDEGPPAKGRDLSWIDMDDKSSTTRLSISMPSSSYSEFSIFSSRSHFDD